MKLKFSLPCAWAHKDSLRLQAVLNAGALLATVALLPGGAGPWTAKVLLEACTAGSKAGGGRRSAAQCLLLCRQATLHCNGLCGEVGNCWSRSVGVERGGGHAES